MSRHSRIDVLVNNAGRSHVGAFEETTDAELWSLHGRAVVVRRFSAYSATKFALEGMSETLADEVGPLAIKVLIVEPGDGRLRGQRRRHPGDARADNGTQAGDPGQSRGGDPFPRWTPKRRR